MSWWVRCAAVGTGGGGREMASSLKGELDILLVSARARSASPAVAFGRFREERWVEALHVKVTLAGVAAD